MQVFKSIIFFILAGLCEIGGGYMIWLWLREGKSVWVAEFGSAVMILYGVIPTLQPVSFGRAYAAYGGVRSYFKSCDLCYGRRAYKSYSRLTAS